MSNNIVACSILGIICLIEDNNNYSLKHFTTQLAGIYVCTEYTVYYPLTGNVDSVQKAAFHSREYSVFLIFPEEATHSFQTRHSNMLTTPQIDLLYVACGRS